jgi:hypothetical protein
MPMTVEQLGKKLKEMYDNAPRKEQVTWVHLFGIRYAEQIKEIGIREVIEQSGILSTYGAELSKAIRLAKYVKPTKEFMKAIS